MTPREKAEELIKKFEDHSDWDQFDETGNRIENEKICAIICVEQIIQTLIPFRGFWSRDIVDPIRYWQEVLTHLNNP